MLSQSRLRLIAINMTWNPHIVCIRLTHVYYIVNFNILHTHNSLKNFLHRKKTKARTRIMYLLKSLVIHSSIKTDSKLLKLANENLLCRTSS